MTIEDRPPTPFAPEIPHARITLANVTVRDEDVLPGDGYARYLKPFRTIEDTFVLDPTSTGVRVTRTTRVFVAERVSWFGMLGLRIGLKQVHRYVFRSWQRAARRAKLTAVGPARDPAGPRNVSAAWDGGARDPPRP